MIKLQTENTVIVDIPVEGKHHITHATAHHNTEYTANTHNDKYMHNTSGKFPHKVPSYRGRQNNRNTSECSTVAL